MCTMHYTIFRDDIYTSSVCDNTVEKTMSSGNLLHTEKKRIFFSRELSVDMPINPSHLTLANIMNILYFKKANDRL